MSTSAQYRLLNTLRNPQYNHIALNLSPELFTDVRRSVFEAYQISMRRWGNLNTEAVENAFQGELPPELDVPVTVDPMPIIEDLRREAKKRITRELAQELTRQSDSYDPDTTAIKERLEQLESHVNADPSIVPGISQFLGSMRTKQSESYRWLTTGVKALDQLIGGEFPRGEMTIITARSGGGKTALMGSSALSIAQQHLELGNATEPTIFSLEMPKAQLINRWVADLTGIDSRALRYGKNLDGTPFTADQHSEIDAAVARLQKMPLGVIDSERLTADEIVAAQRTRLIDVGSEIFYVDYLQLMGYDAELGMHYGIGNGFKTLKRFVKRYNIAGVVLAQFHEQKQTIRDTTDPEKDAALWIHIDIDYDTKDSHGICSAKIELFKNRHGPVGSTTILYDSKRLRFVSNDSI
jgi:replicative DNA helicase